jgi:hypothetical protein
MATSTGKESCATCNKAGGSAMCNGCQRSFCIKHFVEHRQELSQQIDDIGQEHDLLRRDLNYENNTQSLLRRIDQWEQESIKRIQATAEKARADLQKLLDQTKNELNISVDKFSEEIRTCRESDDYTEIDIQKWMEQLRELRQMIENPSVINIGYDNNVTSAIPLIKVSSLKRQLMPSNQGKRLHANNNNQTFEEFSTPISEKFNERYGSIILSEDGSTALCSQTPVGGSCVSGIGRYSSKKHHIRLRIEKKNSNFLFLGIITASEKLQTYISEANRVYGWWDLGYTIVNGKAQDKNQTQIINSGDELELILNCDHHQIQLYHYRTKTLVDIPVDLTQCPFPWKIFFRLDTQNDCVKILY